MTRNASTLMVLTSVMVVLALAMTAARAAEPSDRPDNVRRLAEPAAKPETAPATASSPSTTHPIPPVVDPAAQPVEPAPSTDETQARFDAAKARYRHVSEKLDLWQAQWEAEVQRSAKKCQDSLAQWEKTHPRPTTAPDQARVVVPTSQPAAPAVGSAGSGELSSRSPSGNYPAAEPTVSTVLLQDRGEPIDPSATPSLTPAGELLQTREQTPATGSAVSFGSTPSTKPDETGSDATGPQQRAPLANQCQNLAGRLLEMANQLKQTQP